MKNNADYQMQIEQIRAASACDLIAIALVEPAENQYVLKWKYASGNMSSRIKKVTLQSGKGIPGMVFKTGKSIFIKDTADFVAKDGLFNYPILALENLKSVGAVPLWHNGRVAGILLGGFREAHLMTEEKLQLLTQAAAKGIGSLDGKEMTLN